jgi:hypothetical protein
LNVRTQSLDEIIDETIVNQEILFFELRSSRNSANFEQLNPLLLQFIGFRQQVLPKLFIVTTWTTDLRTKDVYLRVN